jgi:hypothetical protein
MFCKKLVKALCAAINDDGTVKSPPSAFREATKGLNVLNVMGDVRSEST